MFNNSFSCLSFNKFFLIKSEVPEANEEEIQTIKECNFWHEKAKELYPNDENQYAKFVFDHYLSKIGTTKSIPLSKYSFGPGGSKIIWDIHEFFFLENNEIQQVNFGLKNRQVKQYKNQHYAFYQVTQIFTQTMTAEKIQKEESAKNSMLLKFLQTQECSTQEYVATNQNNQCKNNNQSQNQQLEEDEKKKEKPLFVKVTLSILGVLAAVFSFVFGGE
jgi:hypothetical protein